MAPKMHRSSAPECYRYAVLFNLANIYVEKDE